MKIDYPDGCEQEWREGLTDWQRWHLVSLHRMGKHLPDKTNHGNDERWRQQGCKTRSHGQWRRASRTDRGAHQRIMIERRPYGFAMSGLRRSSVAIIDPETGAMTEVEGWVFCWTWYVGHNMSANIEQSVIEKEGHHERIAA